MSKNCDKCGKVTDDDTQFCPKCGNQSFVDEVPGITLQNNIVEHELGQFGTQQNNGVGFDNVENESLVNNNTQAQNMQNPIQQSVPVQNQQAIPVNSQVANSNLEANSNGVIDNNFFAQQNAPIKQNGDKKKRKKKSSIDGKTICTICVIVGIVLFVLSITLLIVLGMTAEPKPDTPHELGSGYTEENSTVVGNDFVGFIKIPNEWQSITTNDGSLLFSDGGSWYISLSALQQEGATYEGWAADFTQSLSEEGAAEVSMFEERVNQFSTIKSVGFRITNQTYVASWFLTTDNGVIHKITIEGPDRVNDYYDIIFTYNDKQ